MTPEEAIREMTTTGTANVTRRFSIGKWGCRSVFVEELLYDELGPCPGHDLDWMTHYGEIVPNTLYCHVCCGVAVVQ